MRPTTNKDLLVRSLPRFYAGRIMFVDSRWGSNSYDGAEPERPVKSITAALKKLEAMVLGRPENMDDLIVVLDGYNNQATYLEKNGDVTPIRVNIQGVTILFHGKNNVIRGITDAEPIFSIEASQVTIGCYPESVVYIEGPMAPGSRAAFEVTGLANEFSLFGINCRGRMTAYTHAVLISGPVQRTVIHHCRFRNGDIFSEAAHTDCNIFKNWLDMSESAAIGINFPDLATGILYCNRIYTDGAVTHVANGCVWEPCCENQGVVVPPIGMQWTVDTVVYNGGNTYALSGVPTMPANSQAFIDSYHMRFGVEYTIVGGTLTVIPVGLEFIPIVGETITIYWY